MALDGARRAHQAGQADLGILRAGARGGQVARPDRAERLERGRGIAGRGQQRRRGRCPAGAMPRRAGVAPRRRGGASRRDRRPSRRAAARGGARRPPAMQPARRGAPSTHPAGPLARRPSGRPAASRRARRLVSSPQSNRERVGPAAGVRGCVLPRARARQLTNSRVGGATRAGPCGGCGARCWGGARCGCAGACGAGIPPPALGRGGVSGRRTSPGKCREGAAPTYRRPSAARRRRRGRRGVWPPAPAAPAAPGRRVLVSSPTARVHAPPHRSRGAPGDRGRQRGGGHGPTPIPRARGPRGARARRTPRIHSPRRAGMHPLRRPHAPPAPTLKRLWRPSSDASEPLKDAPMPMSERGELAAEEPKRSSSPGPCWERLGRPCSEGACPEYCRSAPPSTPPRCRGDEKAEPMTSALSCQERPSRGTDTCSSEPCGGGARARGWVGGREGAARRGGERRGRAAHARSSAQLTGARKGRLPCSVWLVCWLGAWSCNESGEARLSTGAPAPAAGGHVERAQGTRPRPPTWLEKGPWRKASRLGAAWLLNGPCAHACMHACQQLRRGLPGAGARAIERRCIGGAGGWSAPAAGGRTLPLPPPKAEEAPAPWLPASCWGQKAWMPALPPGCWPLPPCLEPCRKLTSELASSLRARRAPGSAAAAGGGATAAPPGGQPPGQG